MAENQTPPASAGKGGAPASSDVKPLSEHMDAAGLERWQRRALLARRDVLQHEDERTPVTEAAFKAALAIALHGGA